MSTRAHWQKTSTGYALNGATLCRVGRVWVLTTLDGVAHPLGRKASFDHADAVLARHLAKTAA